jgi:hypothetical protein
MEESKNILLCSHSALEKSLPWFGIQFREARTPKVTCMARRVSPSQHENKPFASSFSSALLSPHLLCRNKVEELELGCIVWSCYLFAAASPSQAQTRKRFCSAPPKCEQDRKY